CLVNVLVCEVHGARQPLGFLAPDRLRDAQLCGIGISRRVHAVLNDGFDGQRASHFSVRLASHTVRKHKKIQRFDNAEAILVVRAHPPYIGYAPAYDPHKFSRSCSLFEPLPTPLHGNPVLTLADPFRRRKALTLTDYLFFRAISRPNTPEGTTKLPSLRPCFSGPASRRVPTPHASAIICPASAGFASKVGLVSLVMAKTKKKPRKRVAAPRHTGLSAAQAGRELEELNLIGIALSETRDVECLLALILQKARDITGADAGSLYLVEQAGGKNGSSPHALNGAENMPQLRFRLTQNDSVQFPYAEHTLPITESSMAGYCALHGEVIELADAYRIPKSLPFHFNSSFDEEAGYRTRSLITLPMKNGKGEVLGVLQLINCKRHAKARLSDANAVHRYVHPFPERAVRLGLSLASQAAVAYENSKLYRDIENLFDGFVNAAVKAIEQRDPTTSGHSQRVCQMTVALAEAVDREHKGPYGDLRFSR